jgi:Rieske Fe-S protein
MSSESQSCRGCALTADGSSRREFLSQAAMVAIAATLSACGGSDAPSEPGAGVGEFVVRLADFPALSAVGSVARVRNDPPVALARTATGLVAYSLVCTHAGTTVNINPNFTLRCPNHGAQFAFDGTWTGGTQITRSLVRLRSTTAEGGGSVTITLG